MAKPNLQELRVNPSTGQLVRDDGKVGLSSSTGLQNLAEAADDEEAATVGVPIGGLYRSGSVLMVRVGGGPSSPS